MKIKKGMYGYRRAHRKVQVTAVAICLAAILLQLAARLLTKNAAPRNILTVMAVLTVLPMANFASPMLAGWRYKTIPAAFHDRLVGYETSFAMLYELVVTSKEQIIPLDAVAIHPSGICGYCPVEKLDTKKAEKYINDMFANNRIDARIRITKEEAAFLRRLDSLSQIEPDPDDGSGAYAAALLKSLSM